MELVILLALVAYALMFVGLAAFARPPAIPRAATSGGPLESDVSRPLAA